MRNPVLGSGAISRAGVVDVPGAPWFHEIMPIQYAVVAGSGWTIGQDAGEPFTQYLNNGNAIAINDEVTWPLVLSAGTWQLDLWMIKSSNVGIATFLLDGVAWTTVDGYNAGQVNNFKATNTGLVVATSGKKAFNMKMASKNASSSNYRFNLGYLTLTRTA